jgi:hypothetical protein
LTAIEELIYSIWTHKAQSLKALAAPCCIDPRHKRKSSLAEVFGCALLRFAAQTKKPAIAGLINALSCWNES